MGFDQREILARVTGVWTGTYVTMTPEGDVLDWFRSRQESTLEGDCWYDRVTYFKDPEKPKVLEFKAFFDGDGELVFDDERFAGHLFAATEDVLIFQYSWKSQPDVHIVETITVRPPDAKFRIWQRFDGEALESITVIRETRSPDETPVKWW